MAACCLLKSETVFEQLLIKQKSVVVFICSVFSSSTGFFSIFYVDLSMDAQTKTYAHFIATCAYNDRAVYRDGTDPIQYQYLGLILTYGIHQVLDAALNFHVIEGVPHDMKPDF